MTKPTQKKAPAKKTPAKKTPVKKSSAKKTPAKKAAPKKRAKKAKKSITKKQIWSWIWSVFWKVSLVVIAIIISYSIYLDQIIARKFEGQKWELPAQVYGRSMALYPGAAVTHGQLMAELKLLGYRQVRNPDEYGEFSASRTRIELWRRSFQHPDGNQPKQRVMISFDSNGVTSIKLIGKSKELALFNLEPILIDRIIANDGEDRLFVSTDEIPASIVDALILIEDRKFYQHHGVNPKAILRAAWVNLSAGRTVQGGSTLTQQLAKNFFLTSERSLTRKAREALMALIIDFRYSKQDILEAYLNEVYMGQDKARAIHGMGLAAQFYFGRPIQELTLSQQAFLVAVIKGPSYYNPWRYEERALERRDLVLRVLMESGKISVDQYRKAAKSPLSLRSKDRSVHQKLPAFFSKVKQEIAERYSDSILDQSGIKVYTTLDPMVQKAAEAAVKKTLATLSKKDKDLQVGMVVTDRYTAGIAAMVGDKVPSYKGFNRAMDIRRPIGSLVKPFVYVTALTQGKKYNLATPIADKPITLENGEGKTWSPQNEDKTFKGQVPLLTALKKSMNVPTVNLGMKLGIGNVSSTLKSAGWNGDIPPYPSMFLGAVNGSPLMVAQSYQTIAAGGRYQKLQAVTAVFDSDNNLIEVPARKSKQAINPAATYLIQYAMTKVVESGTAARLGKAFPNVLLAGKTGTSNDRRDSWFAGFDERNVAAVWVGRDDNGKTPLYGSSGAMNVYQQFLKERPPLGLRLPVKNGIVRGYFDRDTGVAKQNDCENVVAVPALDASYHPEPNCGEPLSWWQKITGG